MRACLSRVHQTGKVTGRTYGCVFESPWARFSLNSKLVVLLTLSYIIYQITTRRLFNLFCLLLRALVYVMLIIVTLPLTIR